MVYYPSFASYDSDSEMLLLSHNSNESCIICLEDGNLMYSNFIPKYKKTCNCNNLVHFYCASQWYELNKTCFICRNEIEIVNPFNYIKRIFDKVCKFMLYCIFLINTCVFSAAVYSIVNFNRKKFFDDFHFHYLGEERNINGTIYLE